MLEKILVPTDGSDKAFLAAQYARVLAEKFGGSVTLIHIIQNYYTVPAFSSLESLQIPPSLMDDLESYGKLTLEKTSESFAGFTGKVFTKLDYGSPGIQIVRLAKEDNYSLIVMGRRGLSNFTEILLGSVTHHVMHHAPCSTLII